MTGISADPDEKILRTEPRGDPPRRRSTDRPLPERVINAFSKFAKEHTLIAAFALLFALTTIATMWILRSDSREDKERHFAAQDRRLAAIEKAIETIATNSTVSATATQEIAKNALEQRMATEKMTTAISIATQYDLRNQSPPPAQDPPPRSTLPAAKRRR